MIYADLPWLRSSLPSSASGASCSDTHLEPAAVQACELAILPGFTLTGHSADRTPVRRRWTGERAAGSPTGTPVPHSSSRHAQGAGRHSLVCCRQSAERVRSRHAQALEDLAQKVHCLGRLCQLACFYAPHLTRPCPQKRALSEENVVLRAQLAEHVHAQRLLIAEASAWQSWAQLACLVRNCALLRCEMTSAACTFCHVQLKDAHHHLPWLPCRAGRAAEQPGHLSQVLTSRSALPRARTCSPWLPPPLRLASPLLDTPRPSRELPPLSHATPNPPALLARTLYSPTNLFEPRRQDTRPLATTQPSPAP